jgi:hypothetical protein
VTHIFDENLSLKSGWPRYYTDINVFNIIYPPAFGDIDKDGIWEYFVPEIGLDFSRINAWHMDGTPFLGDPSSSIFSAPSFACQICFPLLADIDGDGMIDILTNSTPDAYYTFDRECVHAWNRFGESLNGWPIIVVPGENGLRTYKTSTLGDINQDGYTDMIVTTSKNELAYIGFKKSYYLPDNAPITNWRYNRRLNSTIPVLSGTAACGDPNGDIKINILDIVLIINYLYKGGSAPDPLQSIDVNSDLLVNILDVVYLINYKYKDGPEPNCP